MPRFGRNRAQNVGGVHPEIGIDPCVVGWQNGRLPGAEHSDSALDCGESTIFVGTSPSFAGVQCRLGASLCYRRTDPRGFRMSMDWGRGPAGQILVRQARQQQNKAVMSRLFPSILGGAGLVQESLSQSLVSMCPSSPSSLLGWSRPSFGGRVASSSRACRPSEPSLALAAKTKTDKTHAGHLACRPVDIQTRQHAPKPAEGFGVSRVAGWETLVGIGVLGALKLEFFGPFLKMC